MLKILREIFKFISRLLHRLQPVREMLDIMLVVLVLLTIIYIIYCFVKKINPRELFKNRNIIYKLCFAGYIASIYLMIIMPLPDINTMDNYSNIKPIFIPLHSIYVGIKHLSVYWTNYPMFIRIILNDSFLGILYNAALFVPLGIYLKEMKGMSIAKTFMTAFGLSMFFEVTQLTGLYFIYPHAYRIFEVDDLIFNTLGGGIGWLCSGKILLIIKKLYSLMYTKIYIKSLQIKSQAKI